MLQPIKNRAPLKSILEPIGLPTRDSISTAWELKITEIDFVTH